MKNVYCIPIPYTYTYTYLYLPILRDFNDYTYRNKNSCIYPQAISTAKLNMNIIHNNNFGYFNEVGGCIKLKLF